MAEGGERVVVQAETRFAPAGIAVYNLEVDGGHTYFVSDGQGAESPVWVHNGTCGVVPRTGMGSRTVNGTADAISSARLNMQLAAEEAAGTRMPSEISGFTRHGLNQAIGRDGVGVNPGAILDAWRNPGSIRYVPTDLGPTFRILGRDATIVVNPQGQIVTTWANGAAGIGGAP